MFTKKTWTDRETEYPTRRRLDIVQDNGSYQIVTVSREEGQVTKQGDAYSASNMNDLETRVYNAVHACDGMIGAVIDSDTTSDATLTKGKFFVHKGKFYEVTKDIPSGGRISPGSNCSESKVSWILYNLTTSFAALRSTITSQINAVTRSLNTFAGDTSETLGYHGSAISDIRANTLGMEHFSLNQVTISSGGANFGPYNVSAHIRYGTVVGIIVTAKGGGQAEVYGGTILDDRPTNCVFHVANLSNPTFSGKVNLEIILLGRAYA